MTSINNNLTVIVFRSKYHVQVHQRVTDTVARAIARAERDLGRGVQVVGVRRGNLMVDRRSHARD